MSEHDLREIIDQVGDITQTVWTSLFDASLREVDPSSPTRRPARTITSCVQIAGPCESAVTVECSTELGRRVASKFFDMPESDATLDEVRDAMGEIANMVGGNLKGLLPGPSRLSLPSVTEGADYTVDIRGAKELRRFCFLAGEEPLVVRVLEREDESNWRHSQRPMSKRPSQNA